jgi:hypothetical protein
MQSLPRLLLRSVERIQVFYLSFVVGFGDLCRDEIDMKDCTCCGEKIDSRASFECDDEDIFVAVMYKTEEKGQCYECAMTNAIIEQGEKPLGFGDPSQCDECGDNLEDDFCWSCDL